VTLSGDLFLVGSWIFGGIRTQKEAMDAEESRTSCSASPFRGNSHLSSNIKGSEQPSHTLLLIKRKSVLR
jgi:hypothetical protein